MQTISYERCKNCGKDVRIYNKKHTYYYGSPYKKCEHCGYEYYDNNAIELATQSEKYVKDQCKDYMLDGGNWYVFIVLMIILSTLPLNSEEFVNRDDVLSVLFLLVGGILFAIKCFIRKWYFWNYIYADSQERVKARKEKVNNCKNERP
jgi:hypothetical protein